MTNLEISHEFAFETTEDGSPTVRIIQSTGLSEAMHSLKGAFSETVYIYGTAIETALIRGFPPRVLSLGLGLGYVEILSAGMFLRELKQTNSESALGLLRNLGGESFELLPELRTWFNNWLTGADSVPDNFTVTYDQILARTAQHLDLPSAEIKALLKDLMTSGQWLIREALDPATTFQKKFGCICFDAFSSKTSPELWTEPFLMEFLAKTCEPQAVLSTYACTGALKRALKGSGFELSIREGFSSKRDSTFAVRSN